MPEVRPAMAVPRQRPRCALRTSGSMTTEENDDDDLHRCSFVIALCASLLEPRCSTRQQYSFVIALCASLLES